MKITFKDGVDFSDMDPEVWYAAFIVSMCLSWIGVSTLVITSGREGDHRPGSKHFEGKAFDFRRWDIPASHLDRFCSNVRMILGEDWDLVMEDTHGHLELDPKEKA